MMKRSFLVILAAALLLSICACSEPKEEDGFKPDPNWIEKAVISNSMAGNKPDSLNSGDLIYLEKIAPEDIKVGDVVGFTEGDVTVVHRVVDIMIDEDGEYTFTTAGDNNLTHDGSVAIDTEIRTEDDIIGILVHRIPGGFKK